MDTPSRKVYTVDELVRLWDETVRRIVEDHEARIRGLERRQSVKQTVVSAVVSIVAAIATIVASSGCHAPVPVAPAPPVEYSVVRLDLYENGEMVGGGTAWFVRPDILATASHVCEEGLVHAFEYYGATAFAVPVFEYDPTVEDELLAMLGDESYPSLGSVEGVCLLQVTSGHTGHPLPLAKDSFFRFKDPVTFVGYPQGVRAYGEGHLTDREDGYLVASMIGWFGSSGSAVLNDRGQVVGVLSATVPGSGLTFLIPVESVHEALEAIDA